MLLASFELKEYTRTFSVSKSIDEVFDVLNDVDDYQSFIPFCSQSTIIEESEDKIKASLQLSFLGASSEFISENTFKNNEFIDMEFVKGPFKKFHAKWFFNFINDNETELKFKMTYSIVNPITDLMFSKNIDVVSQRIIEAFKRKIEG